LSWDRKITDTAQILVMSSLVKEWARLAPHISEALKYSNKSHDISDVWSAIKKNKAQFFPLENSAIVTEIVDYPNQSVCRIWLAGGDLEELMEAEKDVCKWAAKLGCTGMEIIGRKGWSRKLTDYKEASIVLVKEIRDE